MEESLLNQVWQKKSNTAGIIHVFYIDLVDELAEKLSNLGNDCDLYISAPKTQPKLLEKLHDTFPNATIIPFINRGRDILPFIQIINKLLPLNYDYLVKVHTKMSLHMHEGNNWRQDAYEKLLGSPETVTAIKEAFDNDPKLGLLGPEGNVIASRYYLAGNKSVIDDLNNRFKLPNPVPENYLFSASTMFWCRPEVFRPFEHVLFFEEEFGEEPIPSNNTLAHGMERYLGLMTTQQGYGVKAIDAKGQISSPGPYQTIPFVGLPTAFRLRDAKSVVFFGNLEKGTASEHNRIIAPYHQAGMPIIDGIIDGAYMADQVGSADVVAIQREFEGDNDDFFTILNAAKAHHRPIIYDVDELLFDPCENEKIDNNVNFIAATALVEADLVVASTQKLKEALAPFNPNITVLPDYLDDTLWHFKAVSLKKAGPVNLCFIGDDSDQEDINFIAPVLKRLLIDHKPTLHFELIGPKLPAYLEVLPNVSWKPMPSLDYKAHVAFYQSQEADIFIAPLVNNLRNNCKSPKHFFEHAAMGVPGVYSALEPFTTTVDHGVDGFLASTYEDWIRYLDLLISDPERRSSVAQAAQNKVKAHYLLKNNIQNWQDILGDIVPERIVDRSSKASSATFLQSAILEVLQSSNEFGSSVLKNQLKAAKEEAQAYKDSTSWKITKPLRKLSELFRKR